MAFLNKVVLITGAGSGIGEKTAAHFAKLSARLSLVDKDEKSLRKSAENCEKLSRARVFKVNADLTKEDDARRAVESTVKEYGRLDVVINCAGIIEAGDIMDDKVMEGFDNTMAVNFRAVTAVIHYAAPALVKSKGAVVNIASTGEGSFSDAVSKACLTHFTRCVALELAPKGVRVNSVLPGMTKEGIPAENEKLVKAAEESSPLKSLTKAEDVTELTAFLASDKAKSMTGVSYVIDSGVSMVSALETNRNFMKLKIEN